MTVERKPVLIVDSRERPEGLGLMSPVGRRLRRGGGGRARPSHANEEHEDREDVVQPAQMNLTVRVYMRRPLRAAPSIRHAAQCRVIAMSVSQSPVGMIWPTACTSEAGPIPHAGSLVRAVSVVRAPTGMATAQVPPPTTAHCPGSATPSRLDGTCRVRLQSCRDPTSWPGCDPLQYTSRQVLYSVGRDVLGETANR